MQESCATLAEIIGAIGEPDFPARAAGELCGFTGFELAAVILHHDRRRASVISDNFDRVGGRRGIALRLSISAFPVKDHCKNIFRKPGISALAELFALAHRIPLWRDRISGRSVSDSRVAN